MLLGGADDGDGRCSRDANPLDVDAVTGDDMVASGEQADRVGALGTGREADGGATGQVEQIEDPSPGDVFGGDRGRAVLGEGGVLVLTMNRPERRPMDR